MKNENVTSNFNPSYFALIAFFLFCLCVAFRVAYFYYLSVSEYGFLVEDSQIYLDLALSILNDSMDSAGVKNLVAERVLGYPAFVAIAEMLINSKAIENLVLIQIFIDSFTLLLIFLTLHKMCGIAAASIGGLFWTFNLNAIVHSNQILSETLFAFFTALFLYSLVLASRLSLNWPKVFALGLIISICASVRLVGIFLIVFIIFLLLNQVVRGLLGKKNCFALIIVAFVGCFSLLIPRIIDNYQSYGSLAITSQNGAHLMGWWVPLFEEAAQGGGFDSNSSAVSSQFEAYLKDRGYDGVDVNAFELSELKIAFGSKMLMKYPAPVWFDAIGRGVIRTTVGPSLALAPPVRSWKNNSFANTGNVSFSEKIIEFLSNADFRYVIAVVLSCIGIGTFWILTFTTMMQRWLPVWFLAGGFFYIGALLVVAGPVGSAKYRMAFEVVLIIFAAVGVNGVIGKYFREKRHRSDGDASEPELTIS